MSEHLRLGIFAKYWEPGCVKTRLATAIGEKQAAAVYRVFVETILWRFENTAHSRELVFAPDGREQEFRNLLEKKNDGPTSWRMQPQGGGDLGERMQRFFQRSLSKGCSKVVLIGTDSPNVPIEILEQAFKLLDDHQVVLGPTEDGGYYLVGVRDRVPPVFSEIQWSTDRVWSQTVERLNEHRIDHGVLPEWYDVDEIEDLKRLRAEVEVVRPDDGPDKRSVADRLRIGLDRVSDQQYD